MPDDMQVILLSATMPTDVLDVTKRFMRDPIRILVKKEQLTLEGIKQFYIQVEREVWKKTKIFQINVKLLCSLGMETRYFDRLVCNFNYHSSRNLPEHQKEG